MPFFAVYLSCPQDDQNVWKDSFVSLEAEDAFGAVTRAQTMIDNRNWLEDIDLVLHHAVALEGLAGAVDGMGEPLRIRSLEAVLAEPGSHPEHEVVLDREDQVFVNWLTARIGLVLGAEQAAAWVGERVMRIRQENMSLHEPYLGRLQRLMLTGAVDRVVREGGLHSGPAEANPNGTPPPSR